MKTFTAFDHHHTAALVLFLSFALMPSAGAEAAAPASSPSTEYHIHAVVLAVLILCLLALLFWLLLRWSHRLDQASYLGEVYRESVEDFEYKRLAAAPTEKIRDGIYQREIQQDTEWLKRNPRPKPPPGIWPGAFPGWPAPGLGALSTGPDTPTDNMAAPTDPMSETKAREYYNAMDDWNATVEAEANSRLRQDLAEARSRARDRVKSAADVDLSSLRGRGAEFVLEFTTVVVIIFAALILGVLRILSTEQIGTLLAAIAGYVLGRATSRARPAASESQPAVREQKKPGEAVAIR